MLTLFIKKIVGLVILTWGSMLVFIHFVAPLIRDDNSYVGASIEKQRRLHDVLPPRLIMIGGSNLAFGVNSKRIEDSLGIPVVNMGLQGALGLSYILNEARENLCNGDVILLSPEYYLTQRGSKKLLTQLIDINPKAIKFAANGMSDYFILFILNVQRCVSTVFYRITNKRHGVIPKERVYVRNGFTVEGDNVAHLDLTSTYKPVLNYKFEEDYLEAVELMNRFVRHATSQKAKVFFIFPNFPRSLYAIKLNSINRFQKLINDNISCPVINKPTTFVLPDSLFFDSVYHLNKEGREKRTDTLIEVIKKSQILRKKA